MAERVTAKELLDRLEQDPAWRARRHARDEEIRRLEEESRVAQDPLIADLVAAGFRVQSVWDLVNTRASYVAALPVLLEHLTRPYPPGVREGIARALAVPEAKIGWKLLIHLYSEESTQRVKDGLALAIAATADDDAIDTVIDFARDRRLGESRLFLLRALARSRKPEALVALKELEADPELQKEVRVVLRKLKRSKARD